MSRWRSESTLLTRYVGSGVLNTVAGFSVIFLLMIAGAPAVLANIAGYAVGFFLGFVVARKFVFVSNGRLVGEGIRYLLAFLFAFLVNLVVLKLAMNAELWSDMFAQVLAAIAYTVVMYGLSRFIVFRK